MNKKRSKKVERVRCYYCGKQIDDKTFFSYTSSASRVFHPECFEKWREEEKKIV